ncbi:penicillin-binding protein [Candidatus Saccharibacteria bacterium]|nr:penicillin-binding protein [Candidatus Saccharibacteria bacterium]
MKEILRGVKKKAGKIGGDAKSAISNTSNKIRSRVKGDSVKSVKSSRKKLPKFSNSIKASKKPERVAPKPTQRPAKLGFYANITSSTGSSKADQKARRRAEERASKPKHPVKRFFWNLHPKRVLRFWFSKKGLMLSLKIFLVMVLLLVVAAISIFMYFRKDIDQISPSGLQDRVQNTVNRYEDRNGHLLWEDRGDNDYRMVVDGSDISTYLRQATVAIEDRDFFSHRGVSFVGIFRALWNNFRGGAVQGGSTLTQQLVKQIYFSDEAEDRSWGGVPRKIKELILAIEVERMYDKEQIITLYLNYSPYGGRRNGVESGAQAYFGKSAADVNLAEAALLAAIPNNPSWFNPYYVGGHDDLIARQNKVLNDMVIVGFIDQATADEAKIRQIDFREPTGSNMPDSEGHIAIRPLADQFENMKAPHFVIEARDWLEDKLGMKRVRAGGWTFRLTLDYTAQRIAEEAVAAGSAMRHLNASDNIALASVDVDTGQVIAMVGSIGYEIPGYGQTNAATSLLEPGSSIKGVLDYAPLFMQRSGTNFAPGSIIIDENIDSIYCAGNTSGRCSLQNASGRFYGPVTIRFALGNSLNIPAVKALIMNNSNSAGQFTGSIHNSLDILHRLGNWSYCAQGQWAGISSAIGGGCSVRPDEHANAHASLARGGAYRPLAYVLEAKDGAGDVQYSWEDGARQQVIDPQVAYMISDILNDPNARTTTFGGQSHSFGFMVPDVWTASKTGTTDKDGQGAKDSWMVSYSPVVSTVVWNGNHDGSVLRSTTNDIVRRVINNYMYGVHHEVYAEGRPGTLGGRWTPNMPIPRPSGIKTVSINGKTDIAPSWYNQSNSSVEEVEMEFDSASRRLATQYTPAANRVMITVRRIKDPVTGRERLFAPDGWDPDNYDDVHTAQTAASLSIPTGLLYDPVTRIVHANIFDTMFALERVSLRTADGTEIDGANISGSSYTYSFTLPSTFLGQRLTLTVTNAAGYLVSVSGTPTSTGMNP